MKIRFLIILYFSCACFFKVQAQEYYITTIAGIDTFGYGGDGGPAKDCILYYPEAINLDKWGNLYIADYGNSRIRKITLSTGIITNVAGTDSFGYSGDGGPATNAKLKGPVDVFTDTFGNIYVADGYNNRIRKITVSNGIITTVAGNGNSGSFGDGGPATNAELNGPSGVCLDKYGNIYIADYYNYRVRKIDIGDGIISTIAGKGTIGYTGDNGPATNAELNQPVKVFVDSLEDVYISDQWNSVIRKVNGATGIITTIGGSGSVGYSGDGGLAINAELNQPSGLFIDRQHNLYFAEYGNGVIRRIDGATGIISTVAGNGITAYSGDGGPATSAELFPGGVLFDSLGIMYIADYQNHRIRMAYNPLGINTLPSKNEIALYPNPVYDVLIIENAAGSKLMIYDVLGKEVYQTFISSDKQKVDVYNLPNGVYLAEFIDENGYRVTKKVVKE